MNTISLKFGCNVSTLFQEYDIFDRLKQARLAGFSCFEAQNLYDVDRSRLRNTKAQYELDMSLINSIPNFNDDKHFGYTCVPEKKSDFLKSLQQSIDFAKALDCRKIHILAGLKQGNSMDVLRKTYIENLKIAANMLEKEKIVGLIEPICPKVKPDYFLDSFYNAVEIIKEVKNEHIKLMLDVYHLEMLHGDAAALIDLFYPHAGHIQVSQAPDREEPSARGLIDYSKIFTYLAQKKYSDFIGLEFFPKKSTKESLSFLKPSGAFNVDFS